MSVEIIKLDVDMLKDYKVDKVVRNLKLIKGKEFFFGGVNKIWLLSIVFIM